MMKTTNNTNAMTMMRENDARDDGPTFSKTENFQSTMSSLNYGHVMERAARDYQIDMMMREEEEEEKRRKTTTVSVNVLDEGGDDDEEFVVEEPKLDGAMTKIVAKKKTSSKKGGKGRATRDRESNKGAASAKTMRTFNQLLEANALDEAPVGIPTYTTIAAGPPSSGAPRKFCSVCGFPSPYTCSRCGMRFCCRKCNQIHSETRCLKMLG